MSFEPAISVVMPVYNGECFLSEAIASILAQTSGNLELIISDDGSTDESVEIARTYANKNPKVVVLTSVHGGIAAAMNRGLAIVKGEYFAPMDQDDVALPDRLERLVGFLRSRPEVVLAGGGMRLIDAAGHAHGERRRPLLPERVAEAMLTSCAVIHPTSVMRTSAVRAVGGYRTAMPFAQDYDLWLRLMEFGKLANISDIVLLKRIHKGATTQCRKQRTAQVLSRSAAYLSYLARTMSVKDFVLTDQPLLTSTLQFIADLLRSDGPIPNAAYYNISRILRHAEFSVPGPNSSNQLYSLYFNRLLQRGSGFEVVRALWYAALYFGVNRWRGDQLAALQAFQERLIVDDAESPATSSNCTRTFLV